MNKLELFANTIRCLSIDMVNNAKSGHQGAPLGFADVMSFLFNEGMNFNPWNENRDRLILSNGHASAMLYSAIYLSGKTQLSIEDLKEFRKFGSICQGHPEYNKMLGIEMTTGALGQGIATSVGIAIALKKKKLKSKIFAIVGDGDLMEGVSHEAMTLASKLNLNNLIILFDNNDICIDGKASDFTTDNISRFKAYGFDVFEANGHDFDEISEAIKNAKISKKPSFISFKTIIGKHSEKEGTSECHGKFVSNDEARSLRKKFGLPEEEFSIPKELEPIQKQDFKCFSENDKFKNLKEVIINIKKSLLNEKEEKSTRYFGGKILSKLSEHFDCIIGGSADLSSSNCTISGTSKPITSHNFSGNYIHYGIREHAMGCIMNGLALEGFVPYGGTFLVFSDYMRPAIRNAALMSIAPIFVFTHDSIAVGEDGATHQPVEQLSSLRLIPNLNVYRPSCDIETAECIELALHDRYTPSVLALSRQNLKNLRTHHNNENLSKKGIYQLIGYSNNGLPKLSIIASGSEVSLALEIKELTTNFDIRILSAPCLELFDKQSISYKDSILDGRKLFIEAGSPDIWYKYKTNYYDQVIGISEFGESGKAQDLSRKFGLCASDILKKIP